MLDPSPMPPRLYPTLLGAAWHELDPAVQCVHAGDAVIHAQGAFRVSRGPGWLKGRLLDAASVPAVSDAAEVRLAVHADGLVEQWHRAFGGRPLLTIQSVAPGGLLAERIGMLEFRFRLVVENGALLFRQAGLTLCLGPFRLPLPERLWLQIAAREAAVPGADDRTSVDVRVTAPTGTLLFSYRGIVQWGSGEDAR